jgi:hypothetical protein
MTGEEVSYVSVPYPDAYGVKPGDDDRTHGVSDKTILHPHLIPMPMGPSPAMRRGGILLATTIVYCLSGWLKSPRVH